MSLAYAQNLIETNWMDVYTSIGGSSGSSNSSGGSGSTAQQPKPTEINLHLLRVVLGIQRVLADNVLMEHIQKLSINEVHVLTMVGIIITNQ